MEDFSLDFEPELKGLAGSMWEKRVAEIAENYGHITRLGPDHSAYFLQAGPKLLVTFESERAIQRSKLAAEPRGFVYAREEGWSCLSIISKRESWFRDPAVYQYFDNLTDNGFFDEFDQVLFYGAGAGGYAAASYSVASPGARVLALRPQATLNPRLTGFDSRYKDQRRLDFTSRYGFAPDMVDGADQAYVIYDPYQRLDACHAAFFAKSNVSLLRAPGLGGALDLTFDIMGIHDDTMLEAMDGKLGTRKFSRMLRARRTYDRFVKNLVKRARYRNHPQLAANLCAFALRHKEDGFYHNELKELAELGFSPIHSHGIAAAE